MSDAIAKKIATFFASYRLKTYTKGQIIVYAGNEPAGVFFIQSGLVRQYDINYRGDEIVVNVFKEGTFFPMSWAINRMPNRYFFEAAVDGTELRMAPANSATQFLKDNPDVTFDLLSRVYKGTDGLLARMTHLMGGSAASRLLLELIIACRRFGKEQKDGYFFAINESELGARSGLSRETVSREMQKLKKAGLVDVVTGGIVIKNIRQLEERLGPNL